MALLGRTSQHWLPPMAQVELGRMRIDQSEPGQPSDKGTGTLQHRSPRTIRQREHTDDLVALIAGVDQGHRAALTAETDPASQGRDQRGGQWFGQAVQPLASFNLFVAISCRLQ